MPSIEDKLSFQGHDTTTSAMCWALQMLATHTDVQVSYQLIIYVYSQLSTFRSGRLASGNVRGRLENYPTFVFAKTGGFQRSALA